MTFDPSLRLGIAAGVLVAAAAGWMAWRATQLDSARRDAEAQRQSLARTWLPDRPEEAERYAVDLGLRRQAQEQALRAVEQRLVPELRPEYQAADLLAAQARLRTDLLALRARAERSRIGLPALLPFEGGFDQDSVARSLQLASLCAVRQVLDLCLEGGVAQVTACVAGRPFSDPAGAYAAFPVDADVEAAPDAVQALLLAFREAHRQGLGLNRIEMAVVPRGGQRVRLTATLLLRARAEWHLAPEAVPRAEGLRGGGSP